MTYFLAALLEAICITYIYAIRWVVRNLRKRPKLVAALVAAYIGSYSILSVNGRYVLANHGGADHRRISGIAAIPNLINELDDASKLLIVTGFDSPLGPGITPVLAALCKQTNRPMHVIAVMPLEVRHRPRRAPSVPWQEAIAATKLLEELSASVEVLDPQTVVDEHTSQSLTLVGLYEFLTKSAADRARSVMS